MNIKRFLKIFGSGIVILLFFFCLLSFLPELHPKSEFPAERGTTFSRLYAERELHLNPDDVLTAGLDDLGIRRFRIPVYWSVVEPSQNQWSFDGVDKDLKLIGDRGGHVILAIGQKLPRWPECWIPEWTRSLTKQEYHQATLTYIEKVVERYKNSPTIKGWQVENEVRLPFGVCPSPDDELIKQEMRLVKKLDPTRPLSTTESGELSFWTAFRHEVDRTGISTYRTVKNPYLGVLRYWYLTPQFYTRKAALLKYIGVRDIYVSELQLEPWSTAPLPQTSLEEQFETVDIVQMKKTIAFAKRMRISALDTWGLEWWYWMKEKQKMPEFWEEARGIYR